MRFILLWDKISDGDFFRKMGVSRTIHGVIWALLGGAACAFMSWGALMLHRIYDGKCVQMGYGVGDKSQ